MTSPLQQNAPRQSVVPVRIEDELKSSFLDYAVSVVISRAIPDVRDGLKPVHRRVLYTMYQLGFWHNKPYHKSVRVVGEVLGKYHPHGDQAVYQTMVGMVQDFSKRYPLLDGQGNWGSIDGDSAAAMRYTEVRMHKITQSILADLDKETVSFVPNFDESTVEPTVLPSMLPNLLINGTAGIAVGMATSIPPHNLGEIVDACIALLENPELTDYDILKYVPGPDFPTAGVIHGRAGIARAYLEGRGSLVVRGVIELEETAKGHALIVTELPYQVIKADFIIKIASLVREKIIEGISNIRDESNKKGMRVFIELKRDAHAETIINLLYKHTSLQNNISIMMLALLDNRPQLFTLKKALQAFLEHRRVIVLKRSEFDCAKAEQQEHILAGIQKVTENAEAAIKLIRNAENSEEAARALENIFLLSSVQSKAVLELRLQRLTSLERDKIIRERSELIEKIEGLRYMLSHPEARDAEIIRELSYLKAEYGDVRKTKIIEAESGVFDPSSFIVDEEVVITLTYKGYVKRIALTTYDSQHRGGKGKMGTASLEETGDVIQDVFIAKNHDELLFFTNFGRVYSTAVYELPEVSRTAKGRAIVNILPLAPQEVVVKLLCARNLEGLLMVMVTKKGTIKRIDAMAFAKIRQTGIRAITLNEGDELAFCALSSGHDSIIIASSNGQGIRFNEREVRVMGRQAAGVRGIRLHNEDYVVGLQVVSDDRDVLFATEHGYGKRVRVSNFRVAHRGGSGVRTIPTNERNGKMIGLGVVDDEADMLLIDQQGKIIRLPSSEVRTMGRQAAGVRLIKLDEGQNLVRVAVINCCEQASAHERKMQHEIAGAIPEATIPLDEELDETQELLDEDVENQEEFTDENENLDLENEE